MINKILNYVLSIVILILIVLLCVQGCSNKNLKTSLEKKNLEYSILQTKWNILISTPPRIITTLVPVIANNDHPFIPTPLPDENNSPGISPPTGTTNSDTSCKEKRYQSTYSIGDSIHILWAARSCGYIKEINFLKISYPYREKIIERFIPCDPCDTISILKKFTKVRNELWLYAKPTLIFPLEVSSITVGIQWQIKKKWGMGAGVGYDLKINSPVVEGIFLFNLK